MKTKIYPYNINPEDTDENPLTWRRLIDWLAKTEWVEGHIYKRISPLDLPYIDDYIQEVWVQILEVPQEKLLGIWNKGKGKFTNYIKSIIMNNINSNSSHLFHNIRKPLLNQIHLDETGWERLDNNEAADAYLQFPIFTDYRKFEYGYEKIEVKKDFY